ncbi:hypothetical protein C0995_007784 [Termitomyces sp. Mi166|nr:hypothetical protein C0995_007784 [Termitomyces sp. Mi166\
MVTPRPPLPERHRNPHIHATRVFLLLFYPVRLFNVIFEIPVKSGALPPVKYQILTCQGKNILVGRMKIETPTPTGHAFILRRFDTEAVSLTTMFRAAFPNAPDHDEKSELQWVKENYDLSKNNGGPHNTEVTRLAGTWVSPAIARILGEAYGLGELITAVVEASPDPNANYRRSQKSAKEAPVTAIVKPTPVSNAAATLPTPSPTAQPNPTKRRKESSPAPAPAPASPTTSPTKVLPRRSSRTRSPGLRSAPVVPLASRTPKTTRTTRREETQTVLASGSELVVVDEETQVVENGITGHELHDQDVAEQRALVEKLKAERDAANKEKVAVDEDEDMDSVPESSTTGVKRSRKDEDEEPNTIQFNPKEPEVEPRVIATNRRVESQETATRKLAWGAAVFAFGVGAASL